ncbi:MAG: CaiB/BaiF CoA-transferase family protein [Mycobacterium sp.]|nr:CaiB/BaiF CoA-transferase family protein [Mycobacterium sp.]
MTDTFAGNTTNGANPVSGPLSGIRILDFTRVLAGPFATMMLGDLGAEIIKVERPGKGDDSRYSGPKANGESTHFITANRNKKSVVLDLKNPEGVRVARELAAKCDVVIENFRPGVMARLGLDYEALSEVNPGLIVASISGFGAHGPMRDRPAFDVIAQAMTGAMSVTGHPNQPPSRLGIAMGDLSGGLYAIIAILAAIHERSLTGKGTAIDIAMYDSMLGLMHYYLTDYFLTGKDPGPVGSGNPSIVPYGAYQAKDGDIIIAAFQTQFWRRLCDVVGKPEMSRDDRFATNDLRVANSKELTRILEEVLVTKTRAEWSEALDAADIPNASVLSVSEVVVAPHTAARGMIESVEHPIAGTVKMTGRPIKFVGRDRAPLRPSPMLGEHTVEVLQAVLDYSDTDIDALVANGATELGAVPAEV